MGVWWHRLDHYNGRFVGTDHVFALQLNWKKTEKRCILYYMQWFKWKCRAAYNHCNMVLWFFQHNFVKPYVYPENPEETQVIVGSMNMGLSDYIRHCQASNSQPVPSQAGADTTRPQWWDRQLHGHGESGGVTNSYKTRGLAGTPSHYSNHWLLMSDLSISIHCNN